MPFNRIFDVIVCGAGPAGLSAAREAASLGMDVLILEKSPEIGYPIHTSGGSWTTELNELGVPAKFMHPIHHLQFASRNAEAIISFEPAEICILDIRGFYQHLAEQASLQGATILTNTTVKEPLLREGQICGVKAVRNGNPIDFKAKLVIDASGFGGVIARQMGLAKPPASYGKGAEYEIVTRGWQQDKTAILLGSEYSPVGYAWVFPWGESRVRVGVGIISPLSKADPLKALDTFINSEDKIAKALQPYSIIETHLGSVPNNGYIDKSFADNLLVVGDSAGQVLGIAGEGIRLALDIGSLAGRTATQAISKADTSEAFLKRYETAWTKQYGRSITLNRKVNESIAGFDDAKWDKVVSTLNEVDPAIILAMMKGYFDLNLLKLILTKNPGLLVSKTMQIIKKAITAG
jgi:digeranylgeranylglycerophospholipid reductase